MKGDQDNFTTVQVLEKFVKSVSSASSINIVGVMVYFIKINFIGSFLGWARREFAWSYKTMDVQTS